MNLNNYINHFLSIRDASDIDDARRQRLFIVSTLLLLVVDIPFFVRNIFGWNVYLIILDLIQITILISVMIIFRHITIDKKIYIYRFILFYYCILLETYLFKGVANGNAGIFIIFYPLFAYTMVGKNEGSLWTLLMFILSLFLLFNPFNIFPAFVFHSSFITQLIPTLIMVIIFSYSSENTREMNSKTLKNEITIRKNAENELLKHKEYLEEIVDERTQELEKQVELLINSEKRYRLIANNINDVIWTMDFNFKFTYISPSVKHIYGYTVDEAMNDKEVNWVSREDYEKVNKTLTELIESDNKKDSDHDKYVVQQMEHIKRNGTKFPVEIKCSILRDEDDKAIGIIGISRDISDRIKVEHERETLKEQLIQSQKMEALGTLVSGLAHDFNNFLTGIMGSFEMLSIITDKRKFENRDIIDKHINLGLEFSKRSAGLINQLLVLSRKHEIKLSPMDINKSINNIYALCKNSFPKSVELDFKIEDGPLLILGDTVQIEQVLLNLCINAFHAMTLMRNPGEKEGGKLIVTAELIKTNEHLKSEIPDGNNSADDWVRIKISDTGVGMNNEIKQKIFEPFFSTKNKEISTGLGLAISFNIIKKHNGTIHVYSEQGRGTCFSIYFPYYNVEKLVPQNNKYENITGSGTVLIIDDEPLLLINAQAILKEHGYNIITADDPDIGIEMFKKDHAIISSVLIDLSMPGKTGLEVYNELTKIDPCVKAILSSGMLDDETKERARQMGIKDFLIKPYLASEITTIMKKVINGC